MLTDAVSPLSAPPPQFEVVIQFLIGKFDASEVYCDDFKQARGGRGGAEKQGERVRRDGGMEG